MQEEKCMKVKAMLNKGQFEEPRSGEDSSTWTVLGASESAVSFISAVWGMRNTESSSLTASDSHQAHWHQITPANFAAS